MADDDIPRSIPDPDPVSRFWDQQAAARAATERLERGTPQRSMSISDDTGAGIRYDETGFRTVDADGDTIAILQTSDGTLVVLDPATGAPRARFGKLLSVPGEYGGEIWDTVNSVWVRLVTGSSVSWEAVTGKPATFPPSSHTHAGGEVTSRVASATDAIGTASGWANNVQGTEFYAVWVGNDGSFSFGRNTSSARYKQNVRDHAVDPDAVLQLRPRIFDRRDYTDTATEETKPGARDEYGLIAEEVNEHVPELVTHFNGQIDGVRYDLIGVALLDVSRAQQTRIDQLEQRIAALEGGGTP